MDFLRQVGERFYKCGDKCGAASAVKMVDTMLTGIHTVAAAEARGGLSSRVARPAACPRSRAPPRPLAPAPPRPRHLPAYRPVALPC